MRGVRVAWAAVAVLVLLLLCPAGAGAGAPDETPQWQVDAAHQGHAVGSRLRPPLRLRWTTEFEGGASVPIVAGGRVFVFVHRESGQPGLLRALDARTGRVVWTVEARGWGLAYEGGKVIAFGDRPMTAHDAATGATVWARDIGGPPFPTVADGVVYVTSDHDNGTVFAIGVADGSILWAAPTTFQRDNGVTVAGPRVFGSFPFGGDVFALDRSSGGELWNHQGAGSAETRVSYPPVHHRDQLYSVEAASVYDAAAGRKLRPFRGLVPPAFAEGLGLTIEREGEESFPLLARDVETDTVRWRFAKFLSGFPGIANGHVYIAASYPQLLWALDLQTGNVVWSGELPAVPAGESPPWITPVFGEGLVVIPYGRRLLAFEHGSAAGSPDSGSGDGGGGSGGPGGESRPQARPRNCGGAARQRANRIRAAGMTCVRARQLVARYTRTRSAGRGFRCESLLVSHSERDVSCSSRSAAVAWRQRLKRPLRLWR